MASSTVTGNSHILVLPFPGQGHMMPLLDLTHHLLTHSGGTLSVTVAVTPKNLPLLQPFLSRHPPPTASALVLPMPPHPSLPAGAENTKDLPPSYFNAIFDALAGLKAPLLRWFCSHPSPPSAILSDEFLGWTHQLASQLGIKRVVYSCTATFATSIALSVWTRFPPLPTHSDDGKVDENGVVLVDDVPGKPEFPCWQLMLLYRAFVSAGPNHFRANWADNFASWGVVFNTFTGLEGAYLDHVRSLLGHDRVWAIGPLCLVGDQVISRPDDGSSSVLSWLDTCGDAEVAYVSFGSQEVLTQEQVDVLALGLEKSGIRFVWKIKEPALGDVDAQKLGKLPHGFEDRVAGRGLVIRDWIPQVMILRHRAVGSFVTQCGWNSVLEGINAGVLLLTWPLEAPDQFWIAKLIVETLKVGVSVGQGMRLLPSSDELAKVLRESVSQSAYTEEKARAMQLGKESFQAVGQGGTSFNDLEMLIQHFNQLPKPHPDVIQECKKRIEEQDQMNGDSDTYKEK